MARQGGRVQLEQSDMRLALNMAKMAKGGISRAAIEETQQLIKKPRAEVREEKKRGVEFPGHNKVKAAIERHPAMFRENHTDGCLPCQNGTAKNPETHAGGTKARVNLHQDGRHRGPNRHVCQLMTMRGPKQQGCHPHMCIYILRFPTLDFCHGSHVR
jgi:hypothetical protein